MKTFSILLAAFLTLATTAACEKKETNAAAPAPVAAPAAAVVEAVKPADAAAPADANQAAPVEPEKK